ncbi:MAG: glycine cleavage system aminomethyltransferase GcvT [Gammaproteobacteria bacterium]
MTQKTPLYGLHQLLGAKLIDFSGYLMPLHYGSQLDEHHRVRTRVGVFDVSHMGIVDIEGPDAGDFLRRLLANDVARLKNPGRALYSCLLNPAGGVLDDLIVYSRAPGRYRLVLNASRKDLDTGWMRSEIRALRVTLEPRPDLGLLALQGPGAQAALEMVFSTDFASRLGALKPFAFLEGEEGFVARTGYTGEDGFEIALPEDRLVEAFSTWVDGGVAPIGLGARDTLRLEAGLNLYGQDMDETTSPLESNLAWTVCWDPVDRNFIGRGALEQQRREGLSRCLTGVILSGPGVLRSHQELRDGERSIGMITSGTFAPTLGTAIGLARVVAPRPMEAQVVIRDRPHPVRWQTPPFVKRGQVLVPRTA